MSPAHFGVKVSSCAPARFSAVLVAGERDRLALDPQRRQVAIVRREDVAGFAGGDDEARFVGIGEIVDRAIAAAVGARVRLVGGRVEAAAAVERVEAAARGHAQVADPVEQRDVAVDLVLQQRDMLVAPAPLAHVGAVALHQLGEPLVERPRRASRGSRGRACPARRTIRDGRAAARSASRRRTALSRSATGRSSRPA